MNEYVVISQGYPLYAAADFEGQDQPSVCMVVGWLVGDDHAAEPLLLRIGATQMAYFVDESAAVRYIGPDFARARAEANLPDEGKGTAHKAPGTATRPDGTERYAKGATALCGRIDGHARHLWTPPGHDFAIACPGELA
jgi:hypothetical protein